MNDRNETPRQKKAKVIDWNEVYRRIETAGKALEQGLQPTEEKKNKILRARAKMLAIEPERKIFEERLEVVEFLLAHEKYAVETAYVREVYPLKEFTPIPCAPPFVLGIINVRGQILSVIDVKKFFDLPEKGLTDLNKIVILSSETMEFGILADVIVGVRSIPASEMQTSLPTLTGIREEYLKGVTKELITILDAAKLLSDKNIIVHEEIDT